MQQQYSINPSDEHLEEIQKLNELFKGFQQQGQVQELLDLPDDILYIIFSYVPIKKYFRCNLVSAKTHELLSHMKSKIFMRNRILTCSYEGMGLSPSQASVVQDRLSMLQEEESWQLLLKYLQENDTETWRPSVQRFFCFKASAGVDSMLERYGPIGLFNPIKDQSRVYSSNYGRNVLCTGIMTKYESDNTFENDVKEFYDPLMNEYIDKILKVRAGLRGEATFQQLFIEAFAGHAQSIQLRARFIDCVKQRSNGVQQSRVFPIIRKRLLDKDGKTGDEAIVNYVRSYVNVKFLLAQKIACTDKFEVLMSEIQNKEETARVQAALGTNKSYKHYLEFNVPEQCAKQTTEQFCNYMLIDRFRLVFQRGFTCPAQCLAIYAHDVDFDYTQANTSIDLLNDCKSIAQVQSACQANPEVLPNIIGCSEGLLEQIVFDQQFYHRKSALAGTKHQNILQMRLLCWIRIPHKNDAQPFPPIVLPQRVATKYLTVKFINSDATQMEGDGDARDPNVDIKTIEVLGTHLSIFDEKIEGPDEEELLRNEKKRWLGQF